MELINEIPVEAGSAGVLALVVMIARVLGKVIPDDSTGVLGFIRRLAKVIGMYTPNRKTKGDPLG